MEFQEEKKALVRAFQTKGVLLDVDYTNDFNAVTTSDASCDIWDNGASVEITFTIKHCLYKDIIQVYTLDFDNTTITTGSGSTSETDNNFSDNIELIQFFADCFVNYYRDFLEFLPTSLDDFEKKLTQKIDALDISGSIELVPAYDDQPAILQDPNTYNCIYTRFSYAGEPSVWNMDDYHDVTNFNTKELDLLQYYELVTDQFGNM